MNRPMAEKASWTRNQPGRWLEGAILHQASSKHSHAGEHSSSAGPGGFTWQKFWCELICVVKSGCSRAKSERICKGRPVKEFLSNSKSWAHDVQSCMFLSVPAQVLPWSDRQRAGSIGLLLGCFARKIEGDSWFTWWLFSHLPGKPIYFPEKGPYGFSVDVFPGYFESLVNGFEYLPHLWNDQQRALLRGTDAEQTARLSALGSRLSALDRHTGCQGKHRGLGSPERLHLSWRNCDTLQLPFAEDVFLFSPVGFKRNL